MTKYAFILALSLVAGAYICLSNADGREILDSMRDIDIPSGGAVSPAVPSENIRLDSMLVTVRLKRDRYIVDSVFHLFNTGDTTTERVGLPKHWENVTQGRSFTEPSRRMDFLRFDAWVDGRKTDFEEELDFLTKSNTPFPEPNPRARIRTETRWMVQRVVFPENAPTTIRIRYEAPYDWPRNADLLFQFGKYHYGMSRHWAGKIAKVVFIVDSTDYGFDVRQTAALDGRRDPSSQRSAQIRKTHIIADKFHERHDPRVITDEISICQRGEFDPLLHSGIEFHVPYQ